MSPIGPVGLIPKDRTKQGVFVRSNSKSSLDSTKRTQSVRSNAKSVKLFGGREA